MVMIPKRFQLNRSGSDSAMPLYKRLPFQRRMLERRSLRVPAVTSGSSRMNPAMLPMRVNVSPTSPGSKLAGIPSWSCHARKSRPKSKLPKIQTPLDLELDLAAQQVNRGIFQVLSIIFINNKWSYHGLFLCLFLSFPHYTIQ